MTNSPKLINYKYMYMYEHSLQFLWWLQVSNYSTNIINSFRRGVLDTTLCDKVCMWFTGGRWFSPGPPVSSTNKTDRHDILISELFSVESGVKHHNHIISGVNSKNLQSLVQTISISRILVFPFSSIVLWNIQIFY